jgi:hypothetical protein
VWCTQALFSFVSLSLVFWIRCDGFPGSRSYCTYCSLLFLALYFSSSSVYKVIFWNSSSLCRQMRLLRSMIHVFK